MSFNDYRKKTQFRYVFKLMFEKNDSGSTSDASWLKLNATWNAKDFTAASFLTLGTSHVALLPLMAIFFRFFNELCWEKAMVAYTKPQQRNKERSERLRGERDQITFTDLKFERWQVVELRKARRRQDVP